MTHNELVLWYRGRAMPPVELRLPVELEDLALPAFWGGGCGQHRERCVAPEDAKLWFRQVSKGWSVCYVFVLCEYCGERADRIGIFGEEGCVVGGGRGRVASCKWCGLPLNHPADQHANWVEEFFVVC